MVKRAPRYQAEQQTPSSGSRRPPQNPRSQQQQQYAHSPVPAGTTVGGILKNGAAKTPYLTNTMTTSTLTESHYRVNLGMSSASHSSGSSQSQSTQQQLEENPNKSYISSTSSNSHTQSTGSQKLFYTSPRLELPDNKIFPTSPVKRRSLTHADDRWQTMSEQAGSHRQDSSVLHVSRRHMTPSVLKAGVLPQVANRIRTLHLRLEQAEDLLPEWLDVISTKFQNLEHLVLTRDHPESPSAQPSRLRRLYILYRLPHLVSIDNIAVTNSERRLARPDDPNGHRVVSQEQWYNLGEGTTGNGKSEGNNNRKEAPKSSEAKEQQQQESTMTRSQRKSALKHQQSNRTNNTKSVPTSSDMEEQEFQEFVERGNQERAQQQSPRHTKQPMSLSEVVSESGEGYELDLVLADAIQRIKDPNINKVGLNNRPTSPMSPSSPTRRKLIRDDAFVGKNLQKHKKAAMTHPTKKPNSQPSSPTKKSGSPNKRGNNYIGNSSKPTSPTKAALGDRHDQEDDDDERDENGDPVEYAEDDSTVTSAYGYGHWSGACFAPFQVCTSQQRKKTKQTFATRNKQNHSIKPKTITATSHTENAKTRKSEPQSKKELPAILSVDTPGTPPGSDYHDPLDSEASPQLSAKASSKYSAMVDETNQKQELKQRQRLFRDSNTSASRGGSTSVPSSKRSHKYSKLLVEMEAANRPNQEEANQSNEDLQQAKLAARSKSSPSKSQPKSSPSKSLQQSQTQKQAPRQSQKQQQSTEMLQKSPPGALQISNKAKAVTKALSLATMDEDEVGTMTGVSIAVVRDANSGMSVATIPSVLQRQAIKYDLAANNKSKAVSEGESLAARRNLAGVTIDVPPPTPNEALNGPSPNKSKAMPIEPKGGKLAGNERSRAQETQNRDDSKSKHKNSKTQKESEKEAPAKRPSDTRPKMEAKQSMDSLEGPTDPEIVDMVLSKLGKHFQTPQALQAGAQSGPRSDSQLKGGRETLQAGARSGPKSDSQLNGGRETNVRFQVETSGPSVPAATAPADLQFPKLTPTSEQTIKENPETAAAFEARVNRMSSKEKKAKSPKKKAVHSQGQVQSSSEEEEHSSSSEADDEEESRGNSVDPASTGTSGRSQEVSSSESGFRSTKENFQELESRLDSLIQNTNTRLPSALRSARAIPLSPENSPKLSAADQRLMAETVSKLDENLRSILELQQNSPEKRASPSASERRRRMQQQRGDRSDTLDDMRRQETVTTPGNTEVSPLEKLETTMAGLFNSIMTQMSPQKRLLTPSAYATSNSMQSISPKKEKRRDEFFPPRDVEEKLMDRLGSNDDDSTLFVVEIERKEVSESITNDFHLQPSNRKAGVEAPSVVHLVDPSVQSSVTAFQAQNAAAASISPRQRLKENPKTCFDDIPICPSDAATATPEESEEEMAAPDIPQEEQGANPLQEKEDPTVIELIDLTDKSTIIDGAAPDPADPSVINLVDVSVQSKTQLSKDQKTGEKPPQKPGELLVPSLEHAGQPTESPSNTQSDTGGNGKSVGISRQGSKLGMVVNLPTVFENTPASASVDGQFVAAAAAGAAAGAEASGDDDPGPDSDQTAAAETDCPSDFIDTNRAVVDEQDRAPPKEITTSSNPILAVLQKPINGRDVRSSNLPSEVVVQNDGDLDRNSKDPPALLANLLTAKPKDSTLSMLSRREAYWQKRQPMTPNSAHFHESPARAERDDFARRDSPPSPKDTGPKLPREILALLQEKEISSSAEAIALLPNEIVMRIEKTMSESGNYAEASPGSGPRNMSNEHNSPESNLVSIPEDVLAMLNQFDNTGSPALTDRAQQNLPKEVLAMLMPSTDEIDGSGPNYDAPVTQTTHTHNTEQEMSWYLIKSRPQFEETIAYLGASDSGDDAVTGTTIYGLPEELNLAKQHILTASYKMQPAESQAYSEEYSRFQHSEQPLGNESYDESHVENYSALPQSLPSRIAVNNGGPQPPHNLALPSLSSKANHNDDQSQNISARPASLPSKVAVNHGAHQPQHNAALPPSLPSKIEVNNDAQPQGTTAAKHHPQRDYQDDGSHLQRPASLPSRVVVKADPPAAASATDDGSHLQIPSSLPSKVMVNTEGTNSPTNASPKKSVSPAKSLSSPFPMQFRSRLAKTLKAATPKNNANATPVLEGTSVMSSNHQAGGKPPTPSLPKQVTVDTKQPPLPPNVETIASPRNFKPVASPLLKSRAKKVVARSKGELPPHNPASSRRSVSSISPRSTRMNRAISRWKQQRTARSSSIMDDDDHEDDEDGNDHEQEEHNDQATAADNESAVSYTE